MRTPFTLLLAATLLLLCVLLAIQSVKGTRQHRELTELQTRLEEASRQVDHMRSANEQLVAERRALRREMDAVQLSMPIAPSRPATTELEPAPDTSSEQDTPALRGFLSTMMADPEMQKFVRDQQRQLLDPLYQPLIQRLGLTEDEADAFKDFLADTQMQGAQHATALFGTSETERAEAMRAMTAEREQSEAAIREFLGEPGYAEYTQYQETLGERAQLNQFRLQNARSEHALTDDQTEWLLLVMREEKQAAASGRGQPLPGYDTDPASMQAFLSEEGVEQLLEQQAVVNQRVYERALEGLTSEQLDAFGRFQTNQMQMMRVGMNMAKAMFSPETPASPTE